MNKLISTAVVALSLCGCRDVISVNYYKVESPNGRIAYVRATDIKTKDGWMVFYDEGTITFQCRTVNVRFLQICNKSAVVEKEERNR